MKTSVYTENLATRMRTSWRVILVSLLGVTRRVQAGLERRVQRLANR